MIAIKVHSIGVVFCVLAQLTASAQDDSPRPLSTAEARALPALPAHENAAFGYFKACLELNRIPKRTWRQSDLELNRSLSEKEKAIFKDDWAEYPLPFIDSPLTFWDVLEVEHSDFSWLEDNRALTFFVQASHKPKCEWGGYRTVDSETLDGWTAGYETMAPLSEFRSLHKLLGLRIRYFFATDQADKAFRDAQAAFRSIQHLSSNNVSQPGGRLIMALTEYALTQQICNVVASHVYGLNGSNDADLALLRAFQDCMTQLEVSSIHPVFQDQAMARADFETHVLSKPNGLAQYLKHIYSGYHEEDSSLAEILGHSPQLEDSKELAAQLIAHDLNSELEAIQICDLPFNAFAEHFWKHYEPKADSLFSYDHLSGQARWSEEQTRAQVAMLRVAIDIQIGVITEQELLASPTGLDTESRIIKTKLNDCFDIFHCYHHETIGDDEPNGYRLSMWLVDPAQRSEFGTRDHVALSIRDSGIIRTHDLHPDARHGIGCPHDPLKESPPAEERETPNDE